MHRAVRERCVVWLRYHSYRGGSGESEVTEREIEPHPLAYYDGAWYAVAYCRLRQSPRDFRLDRIDSLRLLTETFQPRQLNRLAQPLVEAIVRFAPHVVRWVRERQHYGYRGDDRVRSYV